jgi:hypothetical protein
MRVSTRAAVAREDSGDAGVGEGLRAQPPDALAAGNLRAPSGSNRLRVGSSPGAAVCPRWVLTHACRRAAGGRARRRGRAQTKRCASFMPPGPGW